MNAANAAIQSLRPYKMPPQSMSMLFIFTHQKMLYHFQFMLFTYRMYHSISNSYEYIYFYNIAHNLSFDFRWSFALECIIKQQQQQQSVSGEPANIRATLPCASSSCHPFLMIPIDEWIHLFKTVFQIWPARQMRWECRKCSGNRLNTIYKRHDSRHIDEQIHSLEWNGWAWLIYGQKQRLWASGAHRHSADMLTNVYSYK